MDEAGLERVDVGERVSDLAGVSVGGRLACGSLQLIVM